MHAWQDEYDMPPPPMSEKADGRITPKWPHAHQARLAYVDTEFLTFHVDHHFVTDVAVWLEEEPMPRVWKIKPSPSLMENAKRNPRAWAGIQRAAKVNGYTEEGWKDAPVWDEVKTEIAKAVFGRVMVGVNVYAADHSRLSSGFWPQDTKWLMPGATLDLQWLGRIAGHKKTSLAALCEAYGIEEEGVHTAESGVRTVRAVAEAMLGVGR